MPPVIIPITITLLAGLSTVFGGLILFSQNFCRKKHLGFFMGLSAGVMIYISFMELLPDSIQYIGFFKSNLFFFIGIFFISIIDAFIPHHHLQRKFRHRNIADPSLMSTGVMTTISLMIHNVPEGVAVFISSYTDIKLGILLALAIAIHNIPEGIAIAAPIYHATRSKITALKYSFVAAVAEPLGGILAFIFLKNYMDQISLAYIFSIVAGIMVYISFDELLPYCFREKQAHHSIAGIIIGMIIVSSGILLF